MELETLHWFANKSGTQVSNRRNGAMFPVMEFKITKLCSGMNEYAKNQAL
jgi:hypothetical protein